MALVFSVSAPSKKFIEPFATQVTDTLREQYGDSMNFASDTEHYSEELGWSGWRELQERASEACGADQIPHFLSMEAWHGCYLPVETGIGCFEFPGSTPNLDVGGLKELIAELKLIGNALGLPLDNAGLDSLFRKYMDDDDLIDDDMDVQTFTQLLPLARIALQNQLPLWIVK